MSYSHVKTRVYYTNSEDSHGRKTQHNKMYNITTQQNEWLKLMINVYVDAKYQSMDLMG